jgi:DOPA 4,5-dioxygenase
MAGHDNPPEHMANAPRNNFEKYHAHVYFDAHSVEQAQRLCVDAWLNHHVAIGRLHRKPVGPHPLWSCQITFDASVFDDLVPWLDHNRGSLSILVHPLTGDTLEEHSTLAGWLVDEVDLKLEVFEA